MEYAIFPMQYISISQRFSSSHKAWDINGNSTGKSWWVAPCRIKVLAIFPYATTGFYNTVLFGTCDENGNEAAVMCEDGVARVLTFGCTHMDDADFEAMNYTVGKQFVPGQSAYKEGSRGGENMTGNHVHMDVGLGWQYQRVYVDGQYSLQNLYREDGGKLIANTFHQLSQWNVERSLNGYTFSTVNSRYM